MPVDPESVGAVAAGISGGGIVARGAVAAVGRVIGPSLDKIGEMVASYTEFRLENVQRIADNAARKGGDRDGSVPPRVAARLLDEGSYCDDELMAEYFGGLLAAARTPDGRDDRAAMWTAQIAAMSAVEIRAHYLFYREWAALLADRIDLALMLAFEDRRTVARMYLPMSEFISCLGTGDDMGQFSHAITDLVRLGLLGTHYAYGENEEAGIGGSPFPATIMVHPSAAGIELYGWAQGLPGLVPALFPTLARPFDLDPPIPRVAEAYLPDLPPAPELPESGSPEINVPDQR
jgi:hypothetical protein